jgi:DNA repair protein SbcC/Rad50
VRGEPCPVCLQPVARVPKKRATSALGAAEKKLLGAERARAKADAQAIAARATLSKAESAVGVLADRLAALESDLEGKPQPADVARLMDEINSADVAVERARAADTRSRKEVAAAQKAMQALEARERNERQHFEEVRDELIQLKPPKARRTDLVADWEQLIDWAGKRTPALDKKRAQSLEVAAKATADRDGLLEELAVDCADCEVQIEDDLMASTLAALAEARQQEKSITQAIEDAKALRTQLKEVTLEHEVASSLSKHLSATGFERWIVNEALQRLVQGAGTILRELSEDQYSLTIDAAGNFCVTDHHNANEQRSAKTLSGGETFLASLSLALSLSDQLMELAAEGSAKLDAMFLDEGFGALDPETLDTVEASIANLSAGGRMVGIVTHVRDLADRIPVRFAVAKGARTSVVERIEG